MIFVTQLIKIQSVKLSKIIKQGKMVCKTTGFPMLLMLAFIAISSELNGYYHKQQQKRWSFANCFSIGKQ